MNFLKVEYFYILILLLVISGFFFFRANGRRKMMLGRILNAPKGESLKVNVSWAKRKWRFFYFVLAVFSLALAAARPWWGYDSVELPNRGRDVAVIADVSKSMLATDVAPSRLQHEKFFIQQMVEASRGDRFALIAFAGSAFLECPFTADRVSFLQYVSELSPESIPLGGTNLEAALRLALRSFESAEGNNRAIVLLTDGEELSGDSAKLLEELKNMKIPLFVVGIGDPDIPALIPERSENGTVIYKRDRNGKEVQTKLNEPLLQQVAQASGGFYIHSTAASVQLQQVVRGVGSLARGESGLAGSSAMEIERFPYFLYAALFFGLLFLIAGERKGTKKATLGVMLLLLGSMSGFGAESGNALPDAAPTEPMAMKLSTENLTGEELYSQALDAHQAGQLPSASQLYGAGIKKSAGNPEITGRSLNNLGVISHEKVRVEMKKAEEQVAGQQLDGALQQLDAAQKELKSAEDLYLQSSAIENQIPGRDFGSNLRALTIDRRNIEALRKKIEELKKQQQQAQKDMQQAQQQNQQQQQQDQKQDQKDQKQDQQQQNQQQNQQQQSQDQKQDQQQQQSQSQQSQQEQKDQQSQQNQQQSSDQSKLEQSMKQAQQSLEDLQKKAQELKQDELEKKAQQAQSELDKAREKQEQKEFDKADSHLKEAMKQLGSPKDSQSKDSESKDGEKNEQEKSESDQSEKQSEQQNQNQEQPQSQQQPQQQQGQEGKSAEEEQKELDRESARKLLEALTQDEQNLRDAIKQDELRRQKVRQVEKDW